MSTGNLPPEAEQLLEQMHDIQTPDPAGWWPLAPGWWVLIILCLALLGALVYWRVTRSRQRRYRKEALNLLAVIEQRPSEHSLADVNDLLKRVALHAYPQEHSAIARSYGEQWVQWLNRKCSAPVFTGTAAEDLSTGLYRDGRQTPSPDLIFATRMWIQQHAKAGSGKRSANA